MKKVLILTGLSGSGKSTFARRFCLENPNWLRVNRDDFRRSLLSVSLSEYWAAWPDREKIVSKMWSTSCKKWRCWTAWLGTGIF